MISPSKILLFSMIAFFVACGKDDKPVAELKIPSAYNSPNFDNNVNAEKKVVVELSTLTSALSNAEKKKPGIQVGAISYPSDLSGITVPAYKAKINNWLKEVVKAANSPVKFQIPAVGARPANGQEGGLLGKRLLDENGLELKQMIQKGSFGAALYHHAVTVVDGIKKGTDGFTSSAAIDRLLEIHGTEVSFDVNKVIHAANYTKRRSNLDAKTGFFFDIRKNLLTAKAAMEAGADYNDKRDKALDEFLLNWEKSNYATVIFYCNAAKTGLKEAFALSQTTDKEKEKRNGAIGNAMHSYSEGVGFTHGFRGIANKKITDEQIDELLELLLAPVNSIPTSYKFITVPKNSSKLENIIKKVQEIYEFTDAEVASFYKNNEPKK